MAQTVVAPRINVSMVSLKLGDVLSAVLPGAVAVFAVAPWFPDFWALVIDINKASLSTGIGFLFAAAIAGGVLEGLTRISWEPLVLHKLKEPPSVVDKLTPENLPLYERAVQSSYKYVTFYSNLAWATILLLVSYARHSPDFRMGICVLLVVVVGILLAASYVQWTYYVSFQTKVFGPRSDDADQRSEAGNQSDRADDNPQGPPNAGGAGDRSDLPTGRV